MGRFDALSDLEFEDFVAELLSVETGMKFVAGTRGRDRGIDALAVVEGERHAIQCKHFVRSDYSDLRSDAREEVNRLGKLDEPLASYRFATSMELNPTQQAELAEILQHWIGSQSHVLGGKELLALLHKHSGVEPHHPKLWFTGAAQLRRQLSAEQYGRRQALLDEIRPRLPRFVETEALRKARQIVRKGSVCIIDGPPGVGKTTMAQLLLIDSLEHGFEPFEISRGRLGKAWELLELDDRQVFYFDDFLGRIELFEARDEEEDLARFINAIARDEKRRLILTTRDYIFTEARRKSETLYREVDDAHIFVLTPQRYTRVDRAKILYNHLRFSPQLDAGVKGSLVFWGEHLKIIDHPNFNPRVIEWITGFAGNRLKVKDGPDYGGYCLAVLDSPDNLWEAPFRELGELSQAVLFALVGLPERVAADVLTKAFAASCAARGLTVTGQEFEDAMSALDGVFIEGWEISEFRSCSLLNPSLLDFLEREVITSREETETVLRAAAFYEQVEWLWDACRKDSELPPEHLWPAFDEAFSRVFEVSPIEDALEDLLGRPDFHSTLEGRLESAVRRCDASCFQESAARWLPAPASRWVEGVGDGRWAQVDELELMARLVEHGVLEAKTAFNTVKPRLVARELDIGRWQLLAALRRFCPEVVSEADVSRWNDELTQFIGQTLEDPEDFYRIEGLDKILEVADAWGIPPDPDEVESARWVLLELKEMENEESELMGTREMAGLDTRVLDEVGEEDGKGAAGNEDAEIEEMFGRFLIQAEASSGLDENDWDDEDNI